ncbi:MAG TPA: DUF6463 family protein [Albitalea sp.]|nr:DUF6463 family protein [Albitalea sp.]
MLTIAAWLLVVLGLGHTLLGFFWFREPLLQAAGEGLVGRFQREPKRRLAFWFTIFGPLLMLAGHVAVHALQQGDMALLRLVGVYLLPLSIAGALALPRSPFWAAVVIAPLFLAAGTGWLA